MSKLLRFENEHADSSVGQLFGVHKSLNLAYWRGIMNFWSKQWPV